MKNYTSDAPAWSDIIPIVEENDLVNAENDSAAAKQLLQNDLVLQASKVDKEEGKGLVSDTERAEWNAVYQQATGYADRKIADLINGAPSTLDTLGEIADAMNDNRDVVDALNDAIGTKADRTEMESLLGTKLDQTGDTKDNTITFGSSDTATPSGWTDVAVLQSGETHRSFAQKVSTMFKNMRYLWKLCGNTDISRLGDGTITGALGEINSNLEAVVKQNMKQPNLEYNSTAVANVQMTPVAANTLGPDGITVAYNRAVGQFSFPKDKVSICFAWYDISTGTDTSRINYFRIYRGSGIANIEYYSGTRVTLKSIANHNLGDKSQINLPMKSDLYWVEFAQLNLDAMKYMPVLDGQTLVVRFFQYTI